LFALGALAGSRDGAVVKALASHFAPRGFSPGTPVLPFPQKPTFPSLLHRGLLQSCLGKIPAARGLSLVFTDRSLCGGERTFPISN